MKQRRFNDTAADADIREIRKASEWTGERLSIKVTINARRLKSALDRFEEQQLRRELIEQLR